MIAFKILKPAGPLLIKRCNHCNTEKGLSEFHKRAESSDGLNHKCKACNQSHAKEWGLANPLKRSIYTKRYNDNHPEKRRDTRLKSKYGISQKQYNEMFMQQNGKCIGCERHQSEFSRPLCVDHDHVNGEIRGLLCHPCNHSLGLLRDSLQTLDNLKGYLIKSRNKK